MLCILLIYSDIQEAALALGDDLWKAQDGCIFKLKVVSYDAKPTGPFRDQHSAIGKPGHGPGVIKILNERNQTKWMQIRTEFTGVAWRKARHQEKTKQGDATHEAPESGPF
jgi:hypothetical protein